MAKTDTPPCNVFPFPIAAAENPSHQAREAERMAVIQNERLNEVISTQALLSVFIAALSDHLGRSFDETDQMLGGVARNLWQMLDSPQGWTAMALLLSPPGSNGPLLTPTIH